MLKIAYNFLKIVQSIIGDNATLKLFGIYGQILLGNKLRLLQICKFEIKKNNINRYKRKQILAILTDSNEYHLIIDYLKRNKINNINDLKQILIILSILDNINWIYFFEADKFNKIIAGFIILTNKELKLNEKELVNILNNITIYLDISLRLLVYKKLKLSKLISGRLTMICENNISNKNEHVYILSAYPWNSSIGHYIWVDSLLKAKMLGLTRNIPIVMLYDKNKTVNYDLYNRYLKIMDNKVNVKYQNIMPIFQNAMTINTIDGIQTIYELFDKVKNEFSNNSIIKNNHNILNKNRKEIKIKFGIPTECWYATLDVRDGEYRYDPLGNSGNVRNVTVDDYIPLIKEIESLGGFVVRCGSSKSKIINEKNLINYNTSIHKSDEMDIKLIESALFHIGTSSGLSYVPLLFDIPTIYTNDIPLSCNLSLDSSITIPKKVYDKTLKRYLSIEELSKVDILGFAGNYNIDSERFVIENINPIYLKKFISNYIFKGFKYGFGTNLHVKSISNKYYFNNEYRKKFCVNVHEID
jgi:putative glycosyltransferase (TIGR04372 family)